MKVKKVDVLLYAITDKGALHGRDIYKAVEDAVKGGATIIQLREKGLDEKTLTEEAAKLTEICHRYNVPLIVNDNVDAAINSGADGVHVGMEDTPVSEIRARVSDEFIIGATAKTVEQAKKAQAEGADYLGVGAVFPSPTKKDAIRITNEQLREIANSVDIPVAAIGGISKDNILQLQGSGADGAAVVSAIFAQDDIAEAAAELKKLAEKMTR
ncbi:MAG: thiamine phosphate synthase [Ruminococcus sp.]|nr:thiamine phosphate synthase [Ruminococcus sp.]MBQ1434196.1 thiamine phosphate synthase [Ruminococcus sp.]